MGASILCIIFKNLLFDHIFIHCNVYLVTCFSLELLGKHVKMAYLILNPKSALFWIDCCVHVLLVYQIGLIYSYYHRADKLKGDLTESGSPEVLVVLCHLASLSEIIVESTTVK